MEDNQNNLIPVGALQKPPLKHWRHKKKGKKKLSLHKISKAYKT